MTNHNYCGSAVFVAAQAVIRDYHRAGKRRQQHFQASTTPGLLAEYPPAELGSDELTRGFILPPGWPQAEALAALRQELGSAR